MHPVVLVPEGRLDTEWLGRIALLGNRETTSVPPFACVYGLAPTEDAKVAETVERMRRLRMHVVALVDGDQAGDGYVQKLSALNPAPDAVIQWPKDWAVEDLIRWIMEPGGEALLERLKVDLSHVKFESFDELRDLLRADPKDGGLKSDGISHDTLCSVLEQVSNVRARAAEVCEALIRVALGNTAGYTRLTQINVPGALPHFRFVP
jgi:DNA primase